MLGITSALWKSYFPPPKKMPNFEESNLCEVNLNYKWNSPSLALPDCFGVQFHNQSSTLSVSKHMPWRATFPFFPLSVSHAAETSEQTGGPVFVEDEEAMVKWSCLMTGTADSLGKCSER